MSEHGSSFWNSAFYGLLVLTLLNAGFVTHVVRIFNNALPAKIEYSLIGDDYPAQLPYKLPPAALVFDNGAPHFGLYADNDWASAFPLNFGFTSLTTTTSTSSSSTPSNNTTPRRRTFQLAMLHQMHCLDVLRVALVTHGSGGSVATAEHAEHCLRYLRQTLLCYADTSLEPSGVGLHNGRWTHMSLQGYGSVHRCRDWTALRRYLRENPPPDLEAGSMEMDSEETKV
ncbi:hypothetical protein C8Q77DRAFT_1062142 [Trametes polyzona]|nr:hypothetical protein C8Q77DRAFT_1062142 [Trametes polyzona]